MLNKLDAEYTIHIPPASDNDSTDAASPPTSGTEDYAPPLRTRRLSSLKDNIFCVTPFILHDSVEEMSVEFTVEGEMREI